MCNNSGKIEIRFPDFKRPRDRRQNEANLSFLVNYEVYLRPVYTCNFIHYDCHPGVCSKLVIVYAARYPLMIHRILTSTFVSRTHSPKCQSQSAKSHV